MAIDHVEISITKEGLTSLAEVAASALTLGVASPVNFQISYFQVGNSGSIEDKKVYQGDCTDVYYVDYDAATYRAAHPTFDTIAVNSVAVDDTNDMIVNIQCYLPPSLLVPAFSCDEIMVFTGNNSIGYKSFMYGVFPTITKQPQYGLSFNITCRFGVS